MHSSNESSVSSEKPKQTSSSTDKDNAAVHDEEEGTEEDVFTGNLGRGGIQQLADLVSELAISEQDEGDILPPPPPISLDYSPNPQRPVSAVNGDAKVSVKGKIQEDGEGKIAGVDIRADVDDDEDDASAPVPVGQTGRPRARLSIADMKSALSGFKQKNIAAGKVNHVAHSHIAAPSARPVSIRSRVGAVQLLNALYLLQTQLRSVVTLTLARWFTIWSRTVATVTRKRIEKYTSDFDEQERLYFESVPVKRASPPALKVPSFSGISDESESWIDVASPSRSGGACASGVWVDVDSPVAMPKSDKSTPTRKSGLVQAHSVEVEVHMHENQHQHQTSTLSAYRRALAHNDKLSEELKELRVLIDDNKERHKIMKAQGSKNVIVIYMKQSLRRKLEFGFHRWVWMSDQMKDERLLKRRSLLIIQEQQKLRAREFHLNLLMSKNLELANTIDCSHAFFRWKIGSIRIASIAEKKHSESSRVILSRELSLLKTELNKRIAADKEAVQNAQQKGQRMLDSMKRLCENVNEAASLTSAINKECEGGLIVDLPAFGSAPQTARGRWSMLRSRMGIDPKNAERVNERLEKEAAAER